MKFFGPHRPERALLRRKTLYVERDERKRIRCMEAGPEGKTEMPETRVVVDGVQGVYVGLSGEGHHEREQVKNCRSQSDVPGEEGE